MRNAPLIPTYCLVMGIVQEACSTRPSSDTPSIYARYAQTISDRADSALTLVDYISSPQLTVAARRYHQRADSLRRISGSLRRLAADLQRIDSIPSGFEYSHALLLEAIDTLAARTVTLEFAMGTLDDLAPIVGALAGLDLIRSRESALSSARADYVVVRTRISRMLLGHGIALPNRN